MAKGMIVVDIPESCNQCQFHYPARDMHTGKYMGSCRLVACMAIRDKNGKPEWCPIKPMPEKKMCSMSICIATEEYHQRKGWNACIDKIEGEDNNK